MLVENIGSYWREDHVFWGAGSQAGSLLGVDAANVTAAPVDFRGTITIRVDDKCPVIVLG